METNTDTNHAPIPPKTADEVCTLLKKQRKKLGLSQQQIANSSGYGFCSTISNIERGTAGISTQRLSQFAKAYQIPEEILAPLLSIKKGRPIGGDNINDCNSDLDVLPLIKKVTASNREKLTVAELSALIKGYAALQKSMRNLAPELRDILFDASSPPKRPSKTHSAL